MLGKNGRIVAGVGAAAAIGALSAAGPSATAPSSPSQESNARIPASAPLTLKVINRQRVIAAGYNTEKPLGAAVARFGPPSSRRRSGVVCNVRWRPLGAQFVFANLGGRNPCANRWGKAGSAKLTGARWRTLGGVQIGDPTARIATNAPEAIRCDPDLLLAPNPRGSKNVVRPVTAKERTDIRRRCAALSGNRPNGTWWIAPIFSPIGESSFFPRITIVVRAGRVRAFELSIGAAGD